MREEITAYKKERILEEAVKLFYERGFSGTTLDDIAGKLGVTKPFIYTHFRSKVELLEAICRPTIEMSLDAIAKGPSGTVGLPAGGTAEVILVVPGQPLCRDAGGVAADIPRALLAVNGGTVPIVTQTAHTEGAQVLSTCGDDLAATPWLARDWSW